MVPVDGKSEERQEIQFLNNLKQDLLILENSWKSGKQKPKRVAKHFIEIVDSMVDIVRSESLEPFEPVCGNLKKCLRSVGNRKAELGKSLWSLASDLVDLLSDSLREESVAWAALEKWQQRWEEEMVSQVPERHESPPDESDQAASPSEAARDADGAVVQEENNMDELNETDAQELLKKAQDALLSGNGENAKELAIKAAELIAQKEIEEAKKKEDLLRADLEMVIHEELEADESLKHASEKMAEREQQLASLKDRLAEARSSFEERERTCQEIREEIDLIEEELTSLQEKHKQLRARFEEVLPARDAAERECSKVTMELESIDSDTETLRGVLQESENQMTEVRRRKAEIEAELEKLSEKVTT